MKLQLFRLGRFYSGLADDAGREEVMKRMMFRGSQAEHVSISHQSREEACIGIDRTLDDPDRPIATGWSNASPDVKEYFVTLGFARWLGYDVQATDFATYATVEEEKSSFVGLLTAFFSVRSLREYYLRCVYGTYSHRIFDGKDFDEIRRTKQSERFAIVLVDWWFDGHDEEEDVEEE